MEIIRRNTDYAIRALLYLAARPGIAISAGEIAANEDIPLDFLHKILQKLVKGGMVYSHRGVQGGFSLAKCPADITVLEILELVQGELAVNKCFLGREGCPRAPQCVLKSRWQEVEKKIAEFIGSITLQELLREMNGGFTGVVNEGGVGEREGGYPEEAETSRTPDADDQG